MPSPHPDAPPEREVAGAAPAPNVTALIHEAMSKAGVLWIEVPGDRSWPAWYAWLDGAAYVVNGPGEQQLPWLPEDVDLIVKSKDSGARLLRVGARAEVLRPNSDEWFLATAALAPKRLNAEPGAEHIIDRWRGSCAVTALRPYGPLVEGLGVVDTTDQRRPAVPSPATTAGWRPKHLRGRPKTRRGTR